MLAPDVRTIRVPAVAVPRPGLLTERRALFGASFVLYTAVAAWLVFVAGSIAPDAWSRVGNSVYMIASRDPHLAAIGFVWNPLPSIAMLPFVPLRALWPPLVTDGFAANLVSALFMAGTVAALAGILRDAGLGRLPRLALVAAFALHPMIILYGANGMSESAFLFALVVATRALLRWVETDHTFDLVVLAMALALAYLARYEAIAVGVAAIGFVGARRVWLARGSWRDRVISAAADVTVAGLPFVGVVVGWALASWIVVGSPFETFTSAYGNAAQVALAGEGISAVTGQGTSAAYGYLARQALGLSPGVLIVAPLALLLWARRRDAGMLVPAAVIGAAIAFSVLTFLLGKSFGWLRFGIAWIPLTVIVAGLTLARVQRMRLALRLPASSRSFVVPGTSAAVGLVLVAATAVALPVSFAVMRDPSLGREEAGQVQRAIDPGHGAGTRTLGSVGEDAAHYIDGLGLPDGSVLLDVAIGFPVFLQSDHPRQFVITTDRDFRQILADPTTFGIRYLVVSNAGGYATLDAVRRAHPDQELSDPTWATLEATFGTSDTAGAWRLYRLTPPA